MTDREYKRRLKQDAARALPPMSAQLRREAGQLAPRQMRPAPPRLTRQGLIGVCLAALMLLCTATVGAVTYVPYDRSAGVVLEINPCLIFTTGPDDVVTAVSSRNREGDLLLSDGAFAKSLIGIPVNEAVVRAADMAVQTGFVRADRAENAVKVSAAGSSGRGRDQMLGRIQSSLESYFMDGGIYAAVLTERIGLSDYRASLGLAADGTWEDTLLQASELPRQQLEQAYVAAAGSLEELYLSYQLPYLKEQLDYYCGIVSEKRSRIEAIYQLNEAIKAHPDNPGFLLKDYWSVRELYAQRSTTDAFTALMAQMDVLVGEYSLAYPPDDNNIPMNSESNLGILWLLFDPFDDEALDGLKADLTDLLHSSLFTTFLSCLDTVNSAAAELINLALQIPQTVTECVARTEELISSSAATRLEQFRSIYQSWREPIAQSAYRAWLDGLKQEYGSLEGFWESRR